ncbi:MAG: ATP-dependent helicase, partial [Aquisalimonadaceae bacterium]
MLDDDQARVVAHDDGPAAVLAGAGSGKTRCTTERALRRLTSAGIAGEAILLLTFTNRAAGEMRERLKARLPAGLTLPWIGTFHSFGSQLLRKHGKIIGVPGNATLMDSEDARRMLDALLAGPFPDKARRQQAMQHFDAITAAGLDVTTHEDLLLIRDHLAENEFGPVATARFIERLRRYDREKRNAAVLDFADLIQLPARLLRADPDLRERVAGGLQDITVDEAQDTDGAQFRLLRLLMPASRTMLLVGDDDQAIYEWRHARPANLRDFIESYAATTYRLERNYRSTPAIVNSGANLVSNNTDRLEKRPRPVRPAPTDDRLRLHHHGGPDAMADKLAEQLRDSIQAGTSPADIAVLYRKNRLARVLETALLRLALPYRVKAGMDLLSYADVRMMLAAGRLASNRRDIRALSRLADLVPGLGARGVNRLLEGGADPLANGWKLKPQAAGALERLSAALQTLHDRGPEHLLDWCMATSLFKEWVRQRARRHAGGSGDADALHQAMRPMLSRMEAVQRALRRRLDGLPGTAAAHARWAAALEVIASGSDDADPDTPMITLSTMHAAKGLEWPEVHVFGFSSGLMPLEREGVVENLAEERRLAYVTITRAQHRLHLHHADRMDLGNGAGMQPTEVSPFLAELGDRNNLLLIDHRGS